MKPLTTYKLKTSKGKDKMYFAFGRIEARDEAEKMYKGKGFKTKKSY